MHKTKNNKKQKNRNNNTIVHTKENAIEDNSQSNNPKIEMFFSNYIKPLILAFVIVLLFRTFFYEPFKVPSGSMKPTILEGDHVLVSKFSYGYGDHLLAGMYLPIKLNLTKRWFYNQPKRGDIIVFRSSQDDDSNNYIKRLVGLPGDKIRLQYGILYINNKPVQLVKDGEQAGCDRDNPSFVCSVYKEILPEGVEYNILDANLNYKLSFPNTTYTYEVPEKHYFFLGDNRDFSKDSRFDDGIGIIPENHIIGKAEFVYWNSQMSIKEVVCELLHPKRLWKKLN